MEPIGDISVAVESTNLLPQVASFVAVVRAGSFTRAATQTGVDKSVLSRRVKALERALQVRLLHRTTRSLRVTEAGQRLLERAAEPLVQLGAAVAELQDSDAVYGRVRVAGIAGMAGLWAQVLRQLRAAHPDLRVELSTSDSLVSLVDEGFDVAVRTGFLPDSTLVARRLATWRYVLVAAPEWVAAHPEVASPADLVPHWLLYGDVPNADRWRLERGDAGVDLVVQPLFVADNAFVLREAALAGLGVCPMLPFLVEPDLAAGRLVRVLPDWRVGHVIPIWGVLPHRSYVPAKVQAVLGAMEAVLQAHAPRWGV